MLYEHRLLKASGEPFTKLISNLPPRVGKTRTLILFSQWCLGKNQSERIITASYNDKLAMRFSRYTRDGIQEPKRFPATIVFSDIFPGVKIQEGHTSIEEWALEGQFFSYMGTGQGGTLTGQGGTILIIDDPVKDAYTAYNENALDEIWNWYRGTFLSRKEEDVSQNITTLEIVNMTRWAKNDLCGKILASPAVKDFYVVSLEAMDEPTGEMLCPDLLSREHYEDLKVLMDDNIFMSNYHQRPLDVKGKLYGEFLTYTEFPRNVVWDNIISYTDTADEGDDYNVTISGNVLGDDIYITGVLCSKEAMEITEPCTANFLLSQRIRLAKIESNSGGRGFARAVEKIIQDNNGISEVVWFHQSENKIARILTNANWIMHHVIMPVNWKDKWSVFYRFITDFQREGKNKHDDCPDALTGLAEMVIKIPDVEDEWIDPDKAGISF